jgi:hypothetical protein
MKTEVSEKFSSSMNFKIELVPYLTITAWQAPRMVDNETQAIPEIKSHLYFKKYGLSERSDFTLQS